MADRHIADVAHADRARRCCCRRRCSRCRRCCGPGRCRGRSRTVLPGNRSRRRHWRCWRPARADLRDGQVVAVDARGIEQHLVLHHRPAETRVVGHARDGAVGAFDHPVFNRLQLLRRAIGALEHVAINQAAGAEQRRHAGSDAGGQSGVAPAVQKPSAAQNSRRCCRRRSGRTSERPYSEIDRIVTICGTPFISSSRGSVTRRSTSSAAWPGHWVMSSTWAATGRDRRPLASAGTTGCRRP